jgi:hypothetical protein
VVYQAGWEAERADDYKMYRLRVRAELLNRIKLICLVHSPLQKYSGFRLTQIKSISFAVLPHTGAYRDRHGRGAGCGGRGQRGLTNGADADGEVVWS